MARKKTKTPALVSPVPPVTGRRHGPPGPPQRLYGVANLRRWLNLSQDVSVDTLCEEFAIRLTIGHRRGFYPGKRATLYGVKHLRHVLNATEKMSIEELCEAAASNYAMSRKKQDGVEDFYHPSWRSAYKPKE